MKVSRRRLSWIGFLVLSVFLSLTLSFQYLHTEESLQKSNSCPACHFQNSTLTTYQVCTLDIPQLHLIETLQCFDFFGYKDNNTVIPSSRSPPIV